METVGSLIDKITINELKIYHMREQLSRPDVTADFLKDCLARLDILCLQKNDLVLELGDLISDVLSGKKQFKVYRQMKMYNEKQFKD